MMSNKGDVFSSAGNLRNFYALYIDKGTYETETHNNIVETLDYIIYRRHAVDMSRAFSVFNKNPPAHVFASASFTELEKQGAWENVKSLTVLKDDKHFFSASGSNNPASFFLYAHSVIKIANIQWLLF